jgi:hypothetical protein
MRPSKITIGLSVHRPEMLPIIAEWMRRHDTILLEEPPAEDFESMLEGQITVNDYIQQIDVEYPAFSRQMYLLLRKLKAEGKKILQVEPYLEALVGIHELFAEGHRPQELPKNSLQYPVYLAERNATGALLAYYQTAVNGTFENTVDAVKTFARQDAARFRLRDSLRAQAIELLAKAHSSVYIEAGAIHYPLWRLLRNQLPPQVQVKSLFLAESALKKIGEKGHLYGPGDQLTLRYIFHPNLVDTSQEKILAARSIIYSKIVEKEEFTDDVGTFPHLRDELACIRTTKRLSLEDCRRLFPHIRRAKSSDARRLVADYVAESGPHIFQASEPG